MNMKSIKKSIFGLGIFALAAMPSAQIFAATSASSNQSAVNNTTVITNAVSSGDISTTSVNVSGVFNAPGSTSVATRFDWGLTPSLGNSTAFVNYSSANGTMTATISGLVSGQQYYFRAYALANASGAGFGNTLSFTTTMTALPSVITSSSSNITTSSATLNGVYNAGGLSSADVKFDYGTSSSSLTQTTGFVTKNASSGTFSENISGLSANTTYYFRATVKTSTGTVNASQILSFTTNPNTVVNNCIINYFYASPSTVNYGANTTLYYSTSNCNSLSVDNGVGTVSSGAASANTNTLYNNTNFTLTAYGSNGAVQSSAYVTVNSNNGGGSNYCTINSFYASPSTVNYGSSTTIYWSTSNCYNVYISSYGSASTSGSFNTSAIYGSTSYTISASGTYGSPSQTLTINSYNNGSGCTYNCYNPYPTPTPDPIYVPSQPQIIYVHDGVNYYDTSYNTETANDALSLSIDSAFPDIYRGDVFTYEVKYKNISSRNIKNARLTIDLPREVELVGYSTGVTSNSRHTVEVSIGALSPKESGSVMLDVRADSNLLKNSRLLAKASLTGQFSNGENTSVSDYSIVSVKNGRNPLLGAAIFGENGFLPVTFGGWLLLLALLAIVVFTGRILYRDYKGKKSYSNAYGADDYHAHH